VWLWLLKLLGDRAADWTRRGERASAGGQWKAAFGHYDRALAADPSVAAAWVGRATARVHLGEPLEGAVADARRGVEADPEAGWPRFSLAWILGVARDYPEALAELALAEPSARDPAHVRLTRAWILRLRGEDGAALAEYDAVLARAPERFDVLSIRAAARAREGRHADALADCERLEARFPRSIDSLLCRARVLLEMSDETGARDAAERAWAMDRKNVDAVQILAETAFFREDYVAAARVLSELPRQGWMRYARGAAAWALRRWDDAARDFEAAADLAGGDRELRDYAELRRWMALPATGADGRFEAYLAGRRQGSEDAWFPALARYMRGQGDENELFRAAGQSVGRLGKERAGQAHFHVGIRRLRAGNPDAARTALRACLDSGIRDYYEFKLARAELRALG
jgi:tetratricopeptide (TPR) repeat protein